MSSHNALILIWLVMWLLVTGIDTAIAKPPVCYGKPIKTLEQLVGDPCAVHNLRTC